MKRFDENLKAYLKEIGKQKVLTREEEIDLFKRLERKDETAREEIIKSNLRFVIKIALMYIGKGLSISDLIQEGNLGLLEVIEKYDYTKGYRFSTYAAFWIKQSIQIALRKNTSLIKIPNGKARMLGKVSETMTEFVQDNGREPTSHEIALELGLTDKKIESLLGIRENIISLDAEYTTDSEPLIYNLMDKNATTARDNCIKNQTKDKLENILDFLNEREKRVVRLRYGFHSGKSLSLRKTSKIIGLSQEGIRRIELRAISKLQRPAIASKLVGVM